MSTFSITDEALMFEKIKEELGTDLPLTDRMLISSLQAQNDISFYITSGEIIKPNDFFKKDHYMYLFIQDGELLMYEHVDFSRNFYAIAKEPSLDFKSPEGKMMHQFFISLQP